MAERKITTIVWRQISPREIELVYADGGVEHIPGTHAEAATMAQAADMGEVSSPVGTVRWVQRLPKAPKRKSNPG